MDDVVLEVVDNLARMRTFSPWLRIIDDARLGQPAELEPEPAAVMAPYLWLLNVVGDGLKLTAAGLLPPAIVVRAVAELGWTEMWWGKGNRESHVRPVRDLRESAQRFGLVRKNHGQLLTTALGRRLVDDPEALWWHVAERVPVAPSPIEEHGGIALLLAYAGGRFDRGELVVKALRACGWVPDGYGELDRSDGFIAARPTWFVFDLLGLAPDSYGKAPRVVSSAAIRLARAALIGRVPVEPRADSTSLLEVTITLRDVSPPVWRRVAVPASMTLRELHDVIQTAMGWEGYHLHQFEIAGVTYGHPDEIDDPSEMFDGVGGGPPLRDERSTTVVEAVAISADFAYEYDFGDDWDLDIEVDVTSARMGADVPHLLDGARAGPAEDCGGAGGYANLLRVLADPTAHDHAMALEWVGGEWDAELFDLDATNELLAMYVRNMRQLRAHL